jgi:MFS family permease
MLAADNNIFTSYFFISFAAAACVVRVPCSKLLGRLPRERCIALSGLLISLSVLCIALWPSNGSFLVGGIFFGIGIGSGWPIFHSMVSAALPVSLRPKGVAASLVMYDLGWCVTPVIIGWLTIRLGIAAAFIVLSIAVAAAQIALHIFFWLPESRKKSV